MKNKIVITTGDVNGIGAEVTIKALNQLRPENVVLISNQKILDFYGGLNFDCEIVEIPYVASVLPGVITRESGEFSFQAVKKACELRPKAIVTAPISKEAIQLAGYKFDGHTEILEHYLARDNQKAEMLFVAGGFRVLLLTRHCALKDIKITSEMLKEKVLRLVQSLNINNPRLALCGLNPHAGENGILGCEEKDVIIPTVLELQKSGVNISLPLPSDTLFIEASEAFKIGVKPPYDCYIAMYHDQGLIPMKIIAGKNAVNMTIGLDIIRTSPCHGTAFDIAGKNIANPTSMIEAIKTCCKFN